ncbi:hypothetical protein ACFT5B_14670 [Luteimicrobium sp. NPDC057192]|uniref:hypothetical protein n=1 Tax=Luteimicrobium sp. NPDC057192 TaxID=3346042 RepID=UPI003637B1AC
MASGLLIGLSVGGGQAFARQRFRPRPPPPRRPLVFLTSVVAGWLAVLTFVWWLVPGDLWKACVIASVWGFVAGVLVRAVVPPKRDLVEERASWRDQRTTVSVVRVLLVLALALTITALLAR